MKFIGLLEHGYLHRNTQQKEAKLEISNIWHAPTKDECLKRAAHYSNRLKLLGQQKAAESAMRDLEHFVTFYDFPREHCIHIRTSNPIEIIFSGVRLRTNVAKRMKSQQTVLYLVFKIIKRLSINWRLIHSPDLVESVLQGKTFRDGAISRRESELGSMINNQGVKQIYTPLDKSSMIVSIDRMLTFGQA